MKKVIGIVGGIIAVAALAFGLYKYVEAGEDAYDDLLSKDDNEANGKEDVECEAENPLPKTSKPKRPQHLKHWNNVIGETSEEIHEGE